MASFTAGTTFVDGVANDVTAAKLGALVTNATPTSGLIQDRTAETVIATNDTLLIGDASDSNTLKRMTVANVMKAELTGTINTTAGTITTLNSTTGTITGLNTTTGTIANFNSTTGTVATLNSTTPTFLGAITASTNIINVGSGQIYKDASGNVGIGTTGVVAKLHVYSASASDKLVRFGPGGISDGNFITTAKNGVSGATNGTPQFSLGMDYSTTYEDLASIKFARGAGAQGNILFFTGSAADGTERLRIDSSGNVGIGTTSPGTKLEVFASANSGIRVTNGTMSGVFFNTSDTSIGIGTTTNHPVVLYSNNTERTRIDTSGNVSIGTATALSKLHVHGDLTMSNATTAVTASTSTITPPATVAGYLTVSINGTSRKIAYYAT